MSTATEALPLPGARAGLARATDVCCIHCRGPVAPADVDAAAERQFCCAGCRTAFAIIHEHGLDGYYALGERREAPVRASGRSFEEFDHEAFQALYVRPAPDGLATVDLYLEGVHCGSCVWLVERVPLLLSGVVRAELEVRRALAHVTWDPAAVRLSEVARALDRLGYRPHPFRGVKAEEVRRKEDRAMLVRIGVAAAIAINVMLAALALYSGEFGGMEGEFSRFFRWISLVLTVPTILGPGSVFFRSAWAAIRTRTLHMDIPIALALLVGLVRGAINTWRDAGPIYFDGLATLTFALLAGRYLQQRGQRAAADSAELLYALAPASARIVEGEGADERIHDVPTEALLPGMVLDVRAGDTLPADGTIVRGATAMDLSLLTGESRPVRVGEGEAVFAGTTNLSTPLRVRVTESGESSRLARILRQVEESIQRRAPVVQLANRIAGWFVAVVLTLTVVTLAIWWPTDSTAAVDHAIALLVVTCPCALALATPLTVSVAIGRAARAGVFIKGGDVVEQLAQPGRIFLDKTGTVTEARTALVAWHGADDVRPLVLALEASSLHPVAEGFRRAWPDVPVVTAPEAEHTIGGGIEGVMDGRTVLVGSPGFVRARAAGGDHLPALDPSLTPVLIAVDGQVVAAAGFGDPLRADAPAAVHALRARGWTVGLLSGDAQTVVDAAGRALGLDPDACVGGASPEAKLQAVEAALARGEGVVMVGDGVNDAAAIARASVGIGVHGGAEACLATADVYLMTPGLGALVELTEGAQRTMRVIRRNVLFSVGYNVIGAGLAMAGILSPLVAAVLMPLSSLTVVLASWRSTTFRAPPAPRRTRPAASGAPALALGAPEAA